MSGLIRVLAHKVWVCCCHIPVRVSHLSPCNSAFYHPNILGMAHQRPTLQPSYGKNWVIPPCTGDPGMATVMQPGLKYYDAPLWLQVTDEIVQPIPYHTHTRGLLAMHLLSYRFAMRIAGFMTVAICAGPMISSNSCGQRGNAAQNVECATMYCPHAVGVAVPFWDNTRNYMADNGKKGSPNVADRQLCVAVMWHRKPNPPPPLVHTGPFSITLALLFFVGWFVIVGGFVIFGSSHLCSLLNRIWPKDLYDFVDENNVSSSDDDECSSIESDFEVDVLRDAACAHGECEDDPADADGGADVDQPHATQLSDEQLLQRLVEASGAANAFDNALDAEPRAKKQKKDLSQHWHTPPGKGEAALVLWSQNVCSREAEGGKWESVPRSNENFISLAARQVFSIRVEKGGECHP